MSGADDTVRANALVDRQTYEDAKANADHGELSEAIRHAIRSVAYGSAIADARSLEIELDTLREEKSRIREQIRSLEAELDHVERREQRIEDEIAERRSADERYVGHLEQLEESLADGQSVFAGHAAVRRAADAGGKTPDDVLTDLRERNPELPDEAFTPGRWDEPSLASLRASTDPDGGGS